MRKRQTTTTAKERARQQALDAELRRSALLEGLLREVVQFGGAQWLRAEKLERELLVLRVMRDARHERRKVAQRVSEGKAPAHRQRVFEVACGFRDVERLVKLNTHKKAAVVRERLRMSLPTYRACVAELRERAAADVEFAQAMRVLGFE